MSISREKKDRIQKYILELISKRHLDYVNKTVETFGISKTTIYRYLKELQNNNIINVINDKSRSKEYELVNETKMFNYEIKDKLEEDKIYFEDIEPIVKDLNSNALHIWYYVFCEMMNNAIEHSEAQSIDVIVRKNYLFTDVYIIDNGIGIFRKIQEYYKSNYDENISMDDAVAKLFAGKFTTNKERHSGEGIFYSCRLMDLFVIFSERKLFSHTPYKEIFADLDKEKGILAVLESIKGTNVCMRLSNFTNKSIKEVFDMFSNVDEGFFKTEIPIKNMFENGYPVSRSQARRLGYSLEKFREVILDFEQVDNVGQAFIHELFIVFKKDHPNINISCRNCNDDVQFMIKRVEHTK